MKRNKKIRFIDRPIKWRKRKYIEAKNQIREQPYGLYATWDSPPWLTDLVFLSRRYPALLYNAEVCSHSYMKRRYAELISRNLVRNHFTPEVYDKNFRIIKYTNSLRFEHADKSIAGIRSHLTNIIEPLVPEMKSGIFLDYSFSYGIGATIISKDNKYSSVSKVIEDFLDTDEKSMKYRGFSKEIYQNIKNLTQSQF